MFGLPKYGTGIGFRRLLAFCDEHHVDLERLGTASVVITGSNGKGSTTRFVYECLQRTFAKVGCFTSPHLFALRERFEISGSQIDDASLNEYVRRVLVFNDKLRRSNDSIGAFELLFMVALLWFAENDVESVVWEAGIGGRYDPIRVLRSRLSALTSIDFEHTELLGPTRQLIAFDKLDATRQGGVIFISPSVGAGLSADMDAFARVTGRTLVYIDRVARIEGIGRTGDSSHYSLLAPGHSERVRVTTTLLGLHQVYNSATALYLASAHASALGAPLDLAAALEGISGVRWPGRLERVQSDPEVWIDVGHTPEALESVAATLKALHATTEWLIVFGVSANKAVQDIAAIIKQHFSQVIVTRAHHGGFDARRLAADFDKSQVVAVTDTVDEAVKLAVAFAKSRNLKVAVLGGLFLAVEFAYALRGEDPRLLEFF